MPIFILKIYGALKKKGITRSHRTLRWMVKTRKSNHLSGILANEGLIRTRSASINYMWLVTQTSVNR